MLIVEDDDDLASMLIALHRKGHYGDCQGANHAHASDGQHSGLTAAAPAC